MGRMNELSQALDDLVTCGETLIRTAQVLRAMYTDTGADTEQDAITAKTGNIEEMSKETTKVKAEEKPAAPAYSFTDVRKILSGKSRDGFRAEVKALLTKYGSEKLSDVDPANYPALVAEAEALGNA